MEKVPSTSNKLKKNFPHLRLELVDKSALTYNQGAVINPKQLNGLEKMSVEK